jgi:ketosteroid isomerase-like protein
MAEDTEAITKTFQNYVASFQTLQPAAVVGYCQTPCMFIASEGVFLMANAQEIQALIAALMERLRARGFSHSEITDMKVSQMSDVSALVSVRRIRYKTDGGALEQLGETYTLRKMDGAWKIVTALVHDPDAIVGRVGAADRI